jgi:hypothetical protein
MQYRKLNSYKYLLVDDYTAQVNICPLEDLKFKFVELLTSGQLLIKEGYAWDGVTGFLSTPKCLLRGSLIHDALYQLMRLNALNQSDRISADLMLEQACLEDGAPKTIVNCLYFVVRSFGILYSKPTSEKEVNVLEAP